MAFYSGTKTNQNLVFGDKGEIGNSSFVYSEAATIASTRIKIKSSDNNVQDFFGDAVAVGNGRIVVGAHYANVGANADQGSAYIYDLDGTNETKITASDGAASDFFGVSVAVGNGRIVVGAHRDDDNGSSSGSAYIFDLNGTQLAKITASDGAAGDEFGGRVDVGSGRIVVGARKDDSSQGSAYIFDLDGTQLAKITAPDGAAGDTFGNAVAVGCGRIVVGASLESSSGSVYVFDLDGNYLFKIFRYGSGGDSFGGSVAVGNGRIVIGSYGDDDNGSNSGSAYIYDLDGDFIHKITASDGAANDGFGSVAISSNRIVVGAYDDDDNGSASGSAYIFDLDGNQLENIIDPDGNALAFFGDRVAMGNGKIVIGAAGDGEGASPNGFQSGAVCIYDINEYYDDYVEKIADNRIGQYTRLTG
jgi:hypothetical protein